MDGWMDGQGMGVGMKGSEREEEEVRYWHRKCLDFIQDTQCMKRRQELEKGLCGTGWQRGATVK